MSGNREYKSDVFSMLMEDPNNALQLYNALNGSNYEEPSQVEIIKLDRGISLSLRNDASFILDMTLSLYEHQSTYCPNMPIRSLIYFTNILEDLVKGYNLFGKKLIKIPNPRFVIIYNGEENRPAIEKMKLSDAYEKVEENPSLELVCTVYNINFGRNEDLLDKCPFLKGYMLFVNYVREYHKENEYRDLEEAITSALQRCVDENVLKDFFIKNWTEVTKVTKLDYTIERQIELERIDARKEGREEGRKEGREEGREEGRKEGREEGREEERNNFFQQLGFINERIKSGATKEELIEEGFDEKIIESVWQIKNGN